MTWEEAVEWLKSQPDKQYLVEAAYYDEPAAEAAKRFASGGEWREVARILTPWMPGKVLDLGAGNGISSYAFARSGCIVTALEPDHSFKVGGGAIKTLAGETKSRIEVVQGYGEELPFKDGTFDIAYGRQVLHHAEDLRAVCREAARVLRSGGGFLATREHVISRKEDLPRFLESHPLQALYGGENAFLLDEYTEAIKASGFAIDSVFGPHQSPINYFPMTKNEKEEEIRRLISRLTGSFMARIICGPAAARKGLFRLLTRVDNTPGRLYTFLARKII
ncbi:MAG TPA: class I SAM-dependent methyltransferase [Syntrophorhabdaceae bacterium]|jgi:SAM-dependent methyltransferase